MNFDPKAAKELYSQKEDEELVRIALLEPDYLPEARTLAEQELKRRGIEDSDQQLILERLKAEDEDAETERWENSSLAYEIQKPLLDLTFRQKRIISGLLSASALFGFASAEFGWNLFFGYDRWVAAVGLMAFFAFVYRVGPSGKELRDHFSWERSKDDESSRLRGRD